MQTDNSHFSSKVFLRMQAMPGKKNIAVLDAFAGGNKLWDTIQTRLPDRHFTITRIEKEPRKGRIHLTGDNRKFLPTLDLRSFDIIDLDAYGIPFTQVDTVLRSGFRGILHITFIQSMQGNIEKALLNAVGITDAMRKKIQSIFSRKAWQYFKGYLGNQGIARIRYIEYGRKRYITVDCSKTDEKNKNVAR